MDFEGRINQSGEFIPDEKIKYNKTLRSLFGRRVVLSISGNNNPTPLYRFYKLILHRIANELGYLDNELESILLDKYAYVTIWQKGKSKKIYLEPKSMDYQQMKDFVDRVKKWAIYEQNIEI